MFRSKTPPFSFIHPRFLPVEELVMLYRKHGNISKDCADAFVIKRETKVYYNRIVLKASICAVIARSVGKRSALDAP